MLKDRKNSYIIYYVLRDELLLLKIFVYSDTKEKYEVSVMKPSHRKDVIIARIIFAGICVFLLVILIVVAMAIASKLSGKKGESVDKGQPSVKETQLADQDTEIYSDVNSNKVEAVTEITDESEKVEDSADVCVKTTTGVNMRNKPDKNAGVVTVVPENTKLKVLGEENGWIKSEYDGHTGYIYTEFVREVTSRN